MDSSALIAAGLLALISGVFYSYADSLKCANIVIGRALYTGTAGNNKGNITLLTVAQDSINRFYLVLVSALFYLPKFLLIAGGICSYIFFYGRVGGMIFLGVYFLAAYLTRSLFPYELAYYLNFYLTLFKKLIPSNLASTNPQRDAAAKNLLLKLETMYTMYRDSRLGVPLMKEEINSIALGDIAYLKNKNPMLFPDLREKEIARRKELAQQKSSQ
jgi:hypothetical protein